MPENFGIRKIDNYSFELINRKKPLKTDFGLPSDECLEKTKNKYDNVFVCVSMIIVLIIISVLFDLNYISIISYYLKDGFIKGFLMLILIAFIVLLPLFFIISFLSIPIYRFISKLFEKYLINKYSKNNINYEKYKTALTEYECVLGIAENNYKSEYKKYNNIQKEQYLLLIEKQKKEERFWKSLSGRDFEMEMEKLFRKNGYDAKITPSSNDKGIDIILLKDNKIIIVQCKQHNKSVGPHVIRDLYGTLISSKANSAILVCTSGFTSGVYEYAKGKPIELIDIDGILKMNGCEI